MKHRSRIEIFSKILEAANGGGVRKTKIMNKANLSFNQLKEHVILLTERDLIYYEKETQSFKTTEKGLRFLQIYSEIDDMTKMSPLARPSPQRQKVLI